MDFLEAIKNFGDFASKDTGKGLQNIIGLGLSGYGMYKQNKLLDQQNDLLTQNYNYNKMLNDREIAKENMEQDNITNAFNNTFGSTKKKKNINTYTGMSNFQG